MFCSVLPLFYHLSPCRCRPTPLSAASLRFPAQVAAAAFHPDLKPLTLTSPFRGRTEATPVWRRAPGAVGDWSLRRPVAAVNGARPPAVAWRATPALCLGCLEVAGSQVGAAPGGVSRPPPRQHGSAVATDKYIHDTQLALHMDQDDRLT